MSSATSASPEGAPAPQLCANCGTVLLGRYCHVCGQLGHVHRSLLHLLEELLHGVLHFDAKALRTLPLLVFRPGTLTRRYLDGQRVRYLNPLTLFLFSIFLLLFVVSIEPAVTTAARVDPSQRQSALTSLQREVDAANGEVAAATAALAAAHASGRDIAGAEANLSAARVDQRIAAATLAAVRPTLRAGSAASGAAAPTPDLWALMPADLSRSHPWLASALQRIRSNPDLYLYRLREQASHFAFMLIPISLPFLSLMFVRRRDVSAYDHAIFSLYSLSFMSWLAVLVTLLGVVNLSGAAAATMMLVPPVHMFAQLRGTYRLGVAGAVWRTGVLLAVAGTVFLIFLLMLGIIALD